MTDSPPFAAQIGAGDEQEPYVVKQGPAQAASRTRDLWELLVVNEWVDVPPADIPNQYFTKSQAQQSSSDRPD